MGRYPKQIWYVAHDDDLNDSPQAVRSWRRKTPEAALKAWRSKWWRNSPDVKLFLCEGSKVLWEIPIPKELLENHADKT